MYTNTVADKETEMTPTFRKMIAYENALVWYRKDFEKIETFMKNDAQTKTYVMLTHKLYRAQAKSNMPWCRADTMETWDSVNDAILENIYKKMPIVMDRLIFLESILKENKTVFVDYEDRYKMVYELIREVVEKMLLDLAEAAYAADHKE
jgi:hypothetical protein